MQGRQSRLSRLRLHAMGLEFLGQATHTQTPATAMDKTLRKAPITEQALLLELIEHLIELDGRAGLRRQLALELDPAVFALGQKPQGAGPQRRLRATRGLKRPGRCPCHRR